MKNRTQSKMIFYSPRDQKFIRALDSDVVQGDDIVIPAICCVDQSPTVWRLPCRPVAAHTSGPGEYKPREGKIGIV